MEHALWLDWYAALELPSWAERIYLGEETCALRLPKPKAATAVARTVRAAGLPLTLVTPPLTQQTFEPAWTLVRALADVAPECEVVCSDWGLAHRLLCEGAQTPVIGRLLVGQQVDPRIARLFHALRHEQWVRPVRHIDGTTCLLRHRPPSPALSHHYRRCALDRHCTREFLRERSITRAELSNVAQGIELDPAPGWSWSLHVPDVLVSVARRCPGPGEDFRRSARCAGPAECSSAVPWRHETFGVDLARRGNGLYYRWGAMPENLHRLPIDRIVHRP